MKKTLSMLLAVSMAATIVLTGCGGNSGSSGSSGQQETSQAAESKAAESKETAASEAEQSEGEAALALNTEKDFTLKIWLTPQWLGVFDQTEEGAAYTDYFEYVGEKFKEKYPNVTVEVTQITGTERNAVLTSNIQSGTQPDIFFDTSMVLTDFAHMGALTALDDLVADADRSDIFQSAWEGCSVGEHLYFYPFFMVTGSLIVNNDALKAAGHEDMIPAANELGTWTPEEFKQVLADIKEHAPGQNFYPFGFYCKNEQSDQYNNCYLQMYGASMFNEDSSEVTINTDEGVKAMEFIKELYDMGLMEPSPESMQSADTREMFRNQQLGVAYCLTTHYNEIVAAMASGELAPFDISLFMLPGEKQPVSFAQYYGACAFETEDEERMAWAKEFIRFFSSDEELVMASATGGVPVRESVLARVEGDTKDVLAMFMSESDYFVNYNGGIPNYGEFRKALYPEFQAVFSGTMTPKEALDDFKAKADEIIENGRADSELY